MREGNWFLLREDLRQELISNQVTCELFDSCFSLVQRKPRKDYIGIVLNIPGFVIGAEAWWEGKSKEELIENTMAIVVYEVLATLDPADFPKLRIAIEEYKKS